MATITQVRTLVSDPSGAGEILPDADYQVVVDIEDNVYRAASTAAKMLAAHFALKVATTAGPVKMENQQKTQHYLDLATSYDQRASSGGGEDTTGSTPMAPALTGVSYSDIDNNNQDSDRYAGAFYRGMDDNDTGIDTENDNQGV